MLLYSRRYVYLTINRSFRQPEIEAVHSKIENLVLWARSRKLGFAVNDCHGLSDGQTTPLMGSQSLLLRTRILYSFGDRLGGGRRFFWRKSAIVF